MEVILLSDFFCMRDDDNAAGEASFLGALLTSEDNSLIAVLSGNESHTLGNTCSLNSLTEVTVQAQ